MVVVICIIQKRTQDAILTGAVRRDSTSPPRMGLEEDEAEVEEKDGF